MQQISLLSTNEVCLEIVSTKLVKPPALPVKQRISLYDFQQKSVGEVRELMRQGNQFNLLIAPCAGGKTTLSAELARLCNERKGRVCFTVPYQSLLDQTVEKFAATGLDCTVCQGSRKVDKSKGVVVASIQTLASKAKQGSLYDVLGDLKLIIVDESHYTAWSKGYDALEAEYKPRGAYFLLLTATPYRLSKDECMAQKVTGVVTMPQPPELIKMGRLVPSRNYQPSQLFDASKLALDDEGDFSEAQMAKIATTNAALNAVVDGYLDKAAGRKFAAFCVNKRHANALKNVFEQRGIKVGMILGDDKKSDRQPVYEALTNGSIQGVVSVGCLVAGWDEPSIGCIIYVRATLSKALFFQSVGRGARTYPGKTDYIILDYGGNFERFGSPMDIQDYDISPKRDRNDTPSEALTKTCPECDHVVSNFAQHCPECGYVFSAPDDEEEDQQELDLELVEYFGQEDARKITWLKNAKQCAFVQDAHPESPIRDFIQRYGHIPFDEWQKGLVLGDRPQRTQKQQYLDYLQQHAANDIQLRHWQRLEFGKVARG